MRGKWSVTINGLEFKHSIAGNGLHWTGRISGLGRGDIRSSSQVNGGADGGWLGPQFLGIRQIPLDLVVHSADQESLEELMGRVEAALPHQDYLESIVFTTPAGRSYFLRGAKVVQCDPVMDSDRLVDYKVQIMSGDPTFYELLSEDNYDEYPNQLALDKAVVGGLQWSNGGLNWSSTGLLWADGDTNAIAHNLGDTAVYPMIIINGAITNPRFTNLRTGRVFGLAITTAATDVIRIDFMNEYATLNGANIANNISNEDFWPLLPGDNEIEYTSSSSDDTEDVMLYWANGKSGIM